MAKKKAVVPSLHRMFEFVSANSSKFWEVVVSEDTEYPGEYTTITRHGKLGTAGKSSTIYVSEYPNDCEQVANNKIAEKIKKGYTEVAVNTVVVPAGPPLLSKQVLKDLKSQVKNYAKEIHEVATLDYGAYQPEIIVTMMVQGEVIQETYKK